VRTAALAHAGDGVSGRLGVAGYDTSPCLTVAEREALSVLGTAHGWGGRTVQTILEQLGDAERLVHPLRDALTLTEGNPYWKDRALLALLRACLWEGQSFWGWDEAHWRRVLAPERSRLLTANRPTTAGASRHYMIATAYVLGCLPDPSVVVNADWRGVARKVFGTVRVDSQLTQIETVVVSWGYSPDTRRHLRSVVARVMLAHGAPELAGLTTATLERLRHEASISHRSRGLLCCLSRALVHLGTLEEPLREQEVATERLAEARAVGMASDWAAWVSRWEATSTLAPKTRATSRHWLLKVGRWLHSTHRDVTSPAQWTRQLAAEAVAALDQMHVGEFTATRPGPSQAATRPLSPRSKAAALHALSTAFRDAQEWEWIPRRFNPPRSFAVRRSISALINPAPRVIADDVWAKLMWAGLNLAGEDVRNGSAITAAGRAPHYPLTFLRALAAVWLFAGLRSDEIVRLRVGCVRWQASTDVGGARTCLLDVPSHKTGRPYTKPVDALVGEAIAAWETARGSQPLLADRRTGERVSFLSCHRGPARACEVPQREPHPPAEPQGGRPPFRRAGTDHLAPRAGDDRKPALQRQGSDDSIRAAGVARAPLPSVHPALRTDHAQHPDQGLSGCRLLRQERAHHRGSHRP
jgi:integrase